MSHTSTIKGIKITNIAALEAALKELTENGTKLTLIKDATPRAFYPDQKGLGKADYVIKIHAAPYDIGLYKQDDGSYEPRTDFWQKHVEKVLGVPAASPEKADQAKLGKLFQMYAVCAATAVARSQGKMVRRINGTDGKVKLEITGY